MLVMGWVDGTGGWCWLWGETRITDSGAAYDVGGGHGREDPARSTFTASNQILGFIRLPLLLRQSLTHRNSEATILFSFVQGGISTPMT